jgi:glyoxylase-like metal-dependent hydrolase (beta-lactamase superfamily II)
LEINAMCKNIPRDDQARKRLEESKSRRCVQGRAIPCGDGGEGAHRDTRCEKYLAILAFLAALQKTSGNSRVLKIAQGCQVAMLETCQEMAGRVVANLCKGCAVLVLFIAAISAASAQDATSGGASRAPAWDARGLGALPWQGIACLDVSPDGRRIVVGTIAPADDPNVVLLNGEGKIVGQHAVGQRWIHNVALSPNPTEAFALSTMPAGRNDDFPTVYQCGSKVTPVSASLGEAGYPQTIFHYGEHSNHSGTILRPFAKGSVAVIGDQVQWFMAGNAVESRVTFPRPVNAVTTSLVVTPTGEALVGCAVGGEGDNAPENLFLLKRGEKKPLWVRGANTNVAASPAVEKGPYGRPTLPNGQRSELPQRDEKVWAPLSMALYQDAGIQYVATADYQGWQRWIRSSATLQDQNYGTRFVPTRPTVSVYDRDGNTVRRLGPEVFALPQWVDLEFLPDGKQLLAWPHHWSARGLAGQSLLPADDDARSLYLLDVASGAVQRLELPDAVSDVAIASTGQIVAGCWDGCIYRLTAQSFADRKLPAGIEVGGPSLVGMSDDGERVVVAVTSGIVRIFKRDKQLAETDLNRALPHAEKSWVAKATAQAVVAGVWNLPGGRTGSDLGGQRVIQAPDGLILIEAHAGLSFEREWAAIQSAGLDPRQVKYVLPTHEHGDHAPGAYLWRVVTGAQFICSREMAYSLQHHIPICSGYGFHPPVPTDMVIDEDKELDLAGQKVMALRLPGHTFGAMGWLFRKDDKQLVAIGDLIMPDGPLGYAGSINFSATDVLSSLRKLDALRVDIVLPGHGPIGDPNRYVAAGIDVGRHVGWGKMPPEAPDPYFRLTEKNVVVAAWNIDAASADFGDIDGDGRPDIAVVTPTGSGSTGSGSAVRVFLNKGGKFAEKPDHEIPVPQVTACHKIRVRDLNGDGTPDFMVSGTGTALLISRGRAPQYDIVPLDLREAHQVRLAHLESSGESAILINRPFSSYQVVSSLTTERPRLMPLKPEIAGRMLM